MPASSDNLGQDLKAWAAEQLQVDLGAPPQALRAAYLRRVQYENGGPNLTAREALLILTGRSGAARPALALEAAEDKLYREVDDFAERFFKLAIAERKAEWQGLWARGQGLVRIDARLAALRPGLYIVLPHLDADSAPGQLVALVCELFVLRPAARAALRHTRMLEVHRRNKVGDWAHAAQVLRKKHAAIAALEPELIARLADDDRRTEQKRQLNQRMRNRAAAQPAARGKKNNYWWIFLVLGLGASALRALPTKLSTNADSGVAPPAPVVKPMPRLEFKGRDKDGNQRLWVDGNEVVVDPNAPGRVFGKEPADRLLDSSKGKRDDTATDKKDPP